MCNTCLMSPVCDSEVKLAVASFLSDRIVDEILESLSRSQHTLVSVLSTFTSTFFPPFLFSSSRSSWLSLVIFLWLFPGWPSDQKGPTSGASQAPFGDGGLRWDSSAARELRPGSEPRSGKWPGRYGLHGRKLLIWMMCYECFKVISNRAQACHMKQDLEETEVC